jgi:hypothetical protein
MSLSTSDISLDGAGSMQPTIENETPTDRPSASNPSFSEEVGQIRLAYNINIVLPETADLNVLNAIFKSIKENLMR